MLSGRALCLCHFFVNSASIIAPYMQFIITVWWTFHALEYSLSITSIILHAQYPKGEISRKSCNSFKLTYRSFASLDLVQSRQSNSITTCITFSSVKILYVPVFHIPHPITGFNDDSACVTTKTADRITEDG